MSLARHNFIKRIRTLYTSINQTDAVQSKELHETEHNEIARMLRNGLAVVGFASLEDFIKQRSSEILDSIGMAGLSFGHLPEKVQIATTYGAISALNYQLNLRDNNEKIDFVQEHALKISSTMSSGYELTSLAFGYGQANLNSESIKTILTNFHISNPWGQITEIASSLGLAALPLNESFTNAALRRHKAAHVANADTPQGDISQFVNEAISIAIGFDFLLSKALDKLKTHDLSYLDGSGKLSASDIIFRLIKHADGKWKEFIKGSVRAYRTSEDLEILVNDTKRRAVLAGQYYVQFDDKGVILDWAC